ncbi:transaldolase [Alginatibacterium sediminis]|uniref:Transaldolase n=1 Tax=Alginatibacterium sediminis TaxID=2164068 RepID=A0A420EHW6_9ALTE|nr:transaldolase [Alginatibacterium sediminis]RKF20289.1 transaldolase [Alginatibacterium sediminis]
MQSQLEQLKAMSVVVADSGDMNAVAKYQPIDATTNPSLVYKAAQLPLYQDLIDQCITQTLEQVHGIKQQATACAQLLAVRMGFEILQIVPGRISTEVDARLSYDEDACVLKARDLIAQYAQLGIEKDRVLIKLAATWPGICAAERLEREGINCNLTLIFSFAQARACAEAGVFLISPFVGRILDWHKAKGETDLLGDKDPGVKSVKTIYHYFKKHDYQTVVMAASFRNITEIQALAGCDRLTIAPNLLDELSQQNQMLEQSLKAESVVYPKPPALSQAQFQWQHNEDAMAVEKLAEGIRMFALDQIKLENMLKVRIEQSIKSLSAAH